MGNWQAECDEKRGREVFARSHGRHSCLRGSAPRAILAETLCAPLERAELRDLMDVEALVNRRERVAVAIALPRSRMSIVTRRRASMRFD